MVDLHKCAAKGCGRTIIVTRLMCFRHWAMLSALDRLTVNQTWRERLAGRGKDAHIAACAAAVAYVAKREGIAADAVS